MFKNCWWMFKIGGQNCDIEGNSCPFPMWEPPPRKGDSKTDVPFGISLTFLLVAFLDPKQVAWVAIFVQKIKIARFSRSCKHSCCCWRVIWEVQKHQQADQTLSLESNLLKPTERRGIWGWRWSASERFLTSTVWAWFMSLLSTMHGHIYIYNLYSNRHIREQPRKNIASHVIQTIVSDLFWMDALSGVCQSEYLKPFVSRRDFL